MPPSEEPRARLVRLINLSIRQLSHIKRRLPVLRAIVREVEGAATNAPIVNDIFLRLFHDSFDMLVIDLCSLREKAAAKGGLLRGLRQVQLRPFKPRDLPYVEPAMPPEDSSPELAREVAEDFQRVNCEASNKHFEFLFPRGAPVKPEHVEELIERFLGDTLPTANDRNKARAHRYEELPDVAAKYFQSLEQVGQQVEVFEKYFRAVAMVVDLAYHPMDSPMFSANIDETARDFADVMLLGGIDDATVRYGLVDADGGDERYWLRRQRFFAAGGRLG